MSKNEFKEQLINASIWKAEYFSLDELRDLYSSKDEHRTSVNNAFICFSEVAPYYFVLFLFFRRKVFWTIYSVSHHGVSRTSKRAV